MPLSLFVESAYQSVSLYRDLLLLGDLPTITQEKRPYEWIYSAHTLGETGKDTNTKWKMIVV